MRRLLAAVVLGMVLLSVEARAQVHILPGGGGASTSTANDWLLPQGFCDGTAAAPCITWTSDPDTGFWHSGADEFTSVTGGVARVTLDSGLFRLSAATTLGWASGASDSATMDLRLNREGAAIFQFGDDVNGAPTTQTIKSHDGITGTDVPSSPLIIAAGRGTGAGATGDIVFQTATLLGTGTTAQSLATRMTIKQGGLVIPNGSGTELDFSGAAGTNITSANAIFLLPAATFDLHIGAGGVNSKAKMQAGGITFPAAGSTPTLADCGTSPSVITGSNTAGRFTSGTGATATFCTITFVPARTTAPSCVCNNETNIVAVKATATATTLTCTVVSAVDMILDAFNYICVGVE